MLTRLAPVAYHQSSLRSVYGCVCGTDDSLLVTGRLGVPQGISGEKARQDWSEGPGGGGGGALARISALIPPPPPGPGQDPAAAADPDWSWKLSGDLRREHSAWSWTSAAAETPPPGFEAEPWWTQSGAEGPPPSCLHHCQYGTVARIKCVSVTPYSGWCRDAVPCRFVPVGVESRTNERVARHETKRRPVSNVFLMSVRTRFDGFRRMPTDDSCRSKLKMSFDVLLCHWPGEIHPILLLKWKMYCSNSICPRNN